MIDPAPMADPVDEDIKAVLADPAIRARLEAFEARIKRGDVEGKPGSHNAARMIVGLPPVPEDDSGI